jgi:hypothetical protein
MRWKNRRRIWIRASLLVKYLSSSNPGSISHSIWAKLLIWVGLAVLRPNYKLKPKTLKKVEKSSNRKTNGMALKKTSSITLMNELAKSNVKKTTFPGEKCSVTTHQPSTHLWSRRKPEQVKSGRACKSYSRGSSSR